MADPDIWRPDVQRKITIITTTEVVVCMSPRRAKYRQNPLRGIEVWLPHYLYRPPLKRPVFMPTYSCDP